MDVEEELRELLDERDKYIDELEAELAAQEEDNDKQRDELIQCRDKLAELQTQVKNLRVDNDDLVVEVTSLEEQLNSHKSQLDAQKNVLAVAAKSSEEAKRIERDRNQQLQRLELENQRLRAAIIEIEENEDILVNEIDVLVKEKSDFQEINEQLSSKNDALFADLDEQARIHAQLVQKKERAQSELEAERSSHKKDLDFWQKKDAASSSQITRLLGELEQERAKHKESAIVNQNEAFRRELAKGRKEKLKLDKLYDNCLRDKNQAERDLDSAIQALNEFKRNAKEQVASVARRERSALAESSAKLDSANAKLDGVMQRCHDAEAQIEDLRNQLGRSEQRNSSYERNHGLTQVVQAQKQLEADIRRRDHDAKRLSQELGNEIEKCRVLNKACDWLKEKAGLGTDFTIEDDEIKAALQREDNRLQSENAELIRQIEELEDERTKLLSQLRERAMDIGEKGLRFLGMSPDQVSQVMEFASNIRRGVAELPLNDRSKQLLAEVNELKSDKEVDKVTIQRLERELAGAAQEPHGGSNVLEQALNNLSAENQKLREEIAELKAELPSNPNGSALTPVMRNKIKELLGEDLVQMSAAAEMQFVLLMKLHDELAMRKERAWRVDSVGAEVRTPERGQKALDHGRSPVSRPITGRGDGDALLDSGVNGEAEHFYHRAEQINLLSSMERAMKDIRNERDVLAAQLRQLLDGYDPNHIDLVSEVTKLKTKCKSLEDNLNEQKLDAGCVPVATADMSINEQDNANRQLLDDSANQESKTLIGTLQKTRSKLAGYIADVATIRNSIYALQETRIDTSKVAMQISCLNSIIREKNRVISEGRRKLEDLKLLQLSTDKGFHEHRADRSISTNSIDRSILRAASNSGSISPTRMHIQRHLEEATRVVFEKETVIEEQKRTIIELENKLTVTEQAYQAASTEANSMKTDISTLCGRLTEAESAANGIEAYQQKSDEIQGLLENSNKEVISLKRKLSTCQKEQTENESKIKELKESTARTKRILSVTRQGRARGEQNLKASNEEVVLLKDKLEKLEAQLSTLKREKVDAQNAKLKLSRKLSRHEGKLKDLTDEHNRKENSKTVEDLEQRVDVLNKTVSGLASQNSKLRGELAALKLLKKKAEEEGAAASIVAKRPMSSRVSVTRERPMSSRSKSLEEQVKSLQKLLSEEKRHTTDSSSVLDRYQKRVHALEQALASATSETNAHDDKLNDSDRKRLEKELVSLADENRALKHKIEHMKTDAKLDAQIKKLKSDNQELRRENERLSQIDHLDFFEEIEDLKYKYNEAVSRLNSCIKSE